MVENIFKGLKDLFLHFIIYDLFLISFFNNWPINFTNCF